MTDSKESFASELVTEHLGYASRESVEKFLTDLSGDRCWKCKHFDPFEEVTADKTSLGDFVVIHHSLSGICRRHPPKLMHDREKGEIVSCWPEVEGGDWCGEFAECSRSVDDLTRPQS